VNDDLDFVGRRYSERFPTFASFDFQIVRPLQISVFRRKHSARLGPKVFNVTDHFKPRDAQDNISSPNFGRFYNGVGTQFCGKFEFDF
jgi:hypothetical protein